MADQNDRGADDPIDLTDGSVDDRRLATIRGLLAKAEATEFPEEAEAFFNKASELIARYAISEALIWASTSRGREHPDELRLVVHSPYVAQKSVLVGRVAAAHGCRAIRFGSGSARDCPHQASNSGVICSRRPRNSVGSVRPMNMSRSVLSTAPVPTRVMLPSAPSMTNSDCSPPISSVTMIPWNSSASAPASSC